MLRKVSGLQDASHPKLVPRIHQFLNNIRLCIPWTTGFPTIRGHGRDIESAPQSCGSGLTQRSAVHKDLIISVEETLHSEHIPVDSFWNRNPAVAQPA